MAGTRREELITDPEELQMMWILRKIIHPMEEVAAIEFLLDKLKETAVANRKVMQELKRIRADAKDKDVGTTIGAGRCHGESSLDLRFKVC